VAPGVPAQMRWVCLGYAGGGCALGLQMSYRVAFLGLCKAREAGLAAELLQTMEAKGVPTDAMLYRVLMLLILSKGQYSTVQYCLWSRTVQ